MGLVPPLNNHALRSHDDLHSMTQQLDPKNGGDWKMIFLFLLGSYLGFYVSFQGCMSLIILIPLPQYLAACSTPTEASLK